MTTLPIARSNAIWFDERRFQTDKRPWFGEWPNVGGGDFAFAVVGDRCGMATAGVFEGALALLADLKPDFVISVGDLIEGYWREAEDARAEWEDIDAKIAATGLPFFHTVGNHDYGNDTMRDVWRERKGFEYYGFRLGDILFVTLNTEDPPMELSDAFIDIIKRATANVQGDPANADAHMQAFFQDIMSQLSPEQLKDMAKIDLAIGDEQLDFIGRLLEDNRDAKWTFVNMHKPGWKSDNHPQYARLLEMLGDRPYTMFAGHLHSMEYTANGHQHHIQLGRTGGHGHGNGRGDENLILWVSVRAGVPSYRVIHLDGTADIASYPPKTHAQHEEA
ncbi:metallophosphoesterase family protein [Cohnella nanjingensis]|uniref:Metallophosphoesterase n=1 Tax=Cohnella nanjingensis TaxID=1387779 RepID=A0A7X0RQ75_9BACL|nr:metallophosphoesterase [Cohnella nanjingensis]MBB6671669.1 metallophosphoesterase [Cohnella nanjingensis]